MNNDPSEHWTRIRAKWILEEWYKMAEQDFEYSQINWRRKETRGEFARLSLRAKTLGLIHHDKSIDLYYDMFDMNMTSD